MENYKVYVEVTVKFSTDGVMMPVEFIWEDGTKLHGCGWRWCAMKANDVEMAQLFLRAERPVDYWWAAGILAVSTLTDMVDGKIARRFHMVTNLGKILDPVADKATQCTLLVCLAVRHPVLWYVLGLFVVKEGFMLVMGIINLRKRKMLNGALMSGKICTTILFVSMIILVLYPNVSSGALSLLVSLCVLAMLLSFADYFMAYFGKHKKVQDI